MTHLSPRSRVARAAIALVVYALLAPASPAHANDRSDVLRLRAEARIAAGDCAGALPLLRRALDADPAEAVAGRLAGRCLVEQGRYPAAEEILVETARRDPTLEGVQLQLAVARYHREDLAGARAALDAETARTPEYDLYDGLLHLAEGRREQAIASLERARSAAPARVDPIASYHEGLGWAGEGDRRRTRAALERVAAADPDGPWGNEARRQLGSLGDGFRNDPWLAARVGIEWDSNVVLEGKDVTPPRSRRREEDWRLVWDAVIGTEFYRDDRWSAGARLGYGGSTHRDLDAFDVHHPRGALWIDRRIDERTTAHLQYDTSHVLVDDDSFLVAHALTPALEHDWLRGGRTRLYGRLYWHDYRFPRSDPDPLDDVRNRDGHGAETGLEHILHFDTLETEARGGLSFGRFDSRGGEYTHRRHRAHVATYSELPARLGLSLSASYAYRPYSHSTTFPDPSAGGVLEGKTRRDRRWVLQAAIDRPLSDRLSAELRYRYVNQASNVDVFDYERGILGAYFTWSTR